jgi:hypothetical protein
MLVYHGDENIRYFEIEFEHSFVKPCISQVNPIRFLVTFVTEPQSHAFFVDPNIGGIQKWLVYIGLFHGKSENPI